MTKKYFLTLVYLITILKCFSQNSATITGVIERLGSGKKVILGNKPNGISPSFLYVKYDSTISYNDSFQFKKVAFKHPIYNSLEFENCKGWISFFMDNGNITINGISSSVYNSKVRGSKNNEVIREYYNGPYNEWNIIHQQIIARLNAEKDSNANKKILDTVIASMTSHKNKTIEYYKNKVNQNPFPAFYLLRNINLNNYSDSFVSAQFSMLPGYVQNSAPLEDIYYRLQFEKENIKAGVKIPNFIFQTENKNKVDLYSLNYKYKLLVFGASWCVPCINEIKELDSLNNLFQKKGLGILAVNVDNTEEKWKVYASHYKTKCEQLFSGNPNTSKIYKYFNINAIHFLVLLDSKNNILKTNIQLKEIEKHIE